MLKSIQILVGMLLIILFSAIQILSQEITEKPSENTAPKTQATQPADDLEECARLLEKSVEQVKSLKSLTANLENEIAERKKLQGITDEEIKSLRQTIEALKSVIAEQSKLIEILTEQSKTKIKVCIIC